MTKQQQFEQWFLREMDLDVSGMRNSDPDTNTEWPYNSGAESSSLAITVAFKAWMASTAPVVPDEMPEDLLKPLLIKWDEYEFSSRIAQDVWKACRAVMLGGEK